MRKKLFFFVCALLLAVVAQAQWTPDANKRYLLRHVNSGHYLYLHDNYAETNAVNATSLRQVGTAFTVTKNGNNYTFTKAGTSKTLGCANGSWSGWNTSNSVATGWQLADAGNGYYYIKSAKGHLGPNANVTSIGGHIYTNHPQRNDVKWQIIDANAAPVTPANGKVYALYNAYTNGNYPVTSAPGIATNQNATPQLYIFRANGTDSKGTTVFRLQRADFDGKYLTWTNNSPGSVTHSTGTSNFLFLNNASSGYTWQTGTAPVAPLFNFVGFAGNQYTIFGDKKSTTNTGFDGYSRRSATTLLNNAQCAKGANYSTTWKLVEQPYELYNLVITGYTGTGTPTVTYNNAWDNAIQRTPQTNGGGFLIGYDARSLSANHFAAQTMNGYIGEVALNGKTITVTYRRDEIDVTYVYKCGNVEWYRETKSVAPGRSYPDLLIPPTGVKYKNVPMGKPTQNETVVINCEVAPSYPLVYSQSLNNAKWVYFSNFDSNGTMYFLHYNANTPNKLNIGQTTPTAAATHKWAFIGNPLTGYKVYNQAAGSGKIMTSKSPNGDGNDGGNTYIHLRDVTNNLEAEGYNTYWEIESNALGFYMMRKGEGMRANKRGSVFAFWNGGADGGSRLFTVPVENLTPVTSLVTANGAAINGSKKYNIINRNTGKAIGTDGDNLTNMKAGISSTQQWQLIASGNGFQLKNSVNKYLTGGPGSNGHVTTATASSNATTMYLYTGPKVNGVQYYYINNSGPITETSGALRCFIGDDGGGIRSRGSRVGTHMEWYLQEAVPTETSQPEPTASYVGSISSGSYYRLVSNTNRSATMAESGNGVVTMPTDRSSYSQIWQLTSTSGGYTLKNLLSGKYIQGAPGTSAQWKTGGSAGRFYTGTVQSNGNTAFWFTTSKTGWIGSNPNPDTYDALHSAPHQSNTVVGWQGSSDASKWLLERVELTSLDMAKVQELQSALNGNYTNQLANFFNDAACTQLKSNYASMSDDQLRSAMSSLPATLREEAVRVKNNKWNDNAQWSYYEKGFRIHDYEVYSEASVWRSKLGFGAFSHLTQPTGVKVKAGEVVYLLVNSNVADGDAQLYAEQVAGVNLNGGQTALQRGYNAVIPSVDCEIFITYHCTNTNKPLSNYPNIKIHVVGGTCNGAFDMTRGHTNNDWMWMKENMFSDTYLHLRSDYHLMNCYLDRVKNTKNMTGALNIWDFVFEAEEKLMTTKFNNGYYRPVMQIVDNSGGNPNWMSGRVSMPGIWGDGALNYNSLLYSGADGGAQWVIEHEEGHGHQYPINLSGTTEVSNNGLAQIVNHIWGVRTSRGQAQHLSFDYFNNGISWIDYPRSLMNDAVNKPNWLPNCTWIANKVWYQLWLYFHLKGDDGFFARWMEKLQSMNGGIKKTGNSNIARQNASRTISELQGSASTDGSWTSEYMRMALAACEASQTDLYEFFKMWGFFRYADEVVTQVSSDRRNDGIFHIGDYSPYYLRVPVRGNSVDEEALAWCKNKMQSYSKKAPGLLFINDTGELVEIGQDAECVKYDPALATVMKQYADGGAAANAGGLGHYSHYGKNEASGLGFTRNGTTITITGSGAVGFKIYDNTGNLVWVSNRMTFTVNQAIANGIANGTYSLVASLGNDTDLLLSGPGTMYTGGAHAKSFDEATGVETIDNEQPTIDNEGWYTINGVKLNGKPTKKGIYIFNGRKVVVK